jgi:hypothetical protein
MIDMIMIISNQMVTTVRIAEWRSGSVLGP